MKIYLPRYREGTAQEPQSTAAGSIVTGNETVLLVEDDAKLLELTTAALREIGYRVIPAAHANYALAVLSDGSNIDLLLTDIVMPDINGRKLADQARAMQPGLKVL